MKKTYESPVAVVEMCINLCSFCQTSDGEVRGNNGIGNGGVDEEGEIDPDIKIRDGWDGGLW